jgi:lipoate-protein ligase A
MQRCDSTCAVERTETALPIFGFVALHGQPLADGIAQETAWLQAAAASGRAGAHLWQATQGLVVPRSYERSAGWPAACAASAAAGWPVCVRTSGGGVVPLGPGLLNLSLVWRTDHARPVDTDRVYRELCDGLQRAVARLGVAAKVQEVRGSFCDGRFNLAVDGAKVAGTAQSWRRVLGQPVVLAHAVLVVDADPDELTTRCNAFETLLGTGRHYRPEALTSIARVWRRASGATMPPADLAERVRHAVAQSFARVLPPTVRAV